MADVFQTPETTARFLTEICQAPISELHWLASGWHCRVFAFVCRGQSWVLRVSREARHVLKCWPARHWLGQWVPIPAIVAEGQSEEYFWAIQARASGQAMSSLPLAEQIAVVPQVLQSLQQLLQAPLKLPFCGYGPLDWQAGTGASTWQHFLRASHLFQDLSAEFREPHAKWPEFMACRQVYADLLRHCPEEAFVMHGDCKPDNLFVAQGKLSALVDWATLGCGDALYDPAVLMLYLPSSAWAELTNIVLQQPDLNSVWTLERLRCYMLRSALEAWVGLQRRQQHSELEQMQDKAQLLRHPHCLGG